MKVLIINGPNLNLLGTREREIYGTMDMEAYLKVLRERFTNIEIDYFQSNHEGEIIDRLQSAIVDGIVLNAGGYTHTSVAIADAIKAISVPVIEVHISNIYAREEERHTSLIRKYAKASITGMGMESYFLGITAITLLSQSE